MYCIYFICFPQFTWLPILKPFFIFMLFFFSDISTESKQPKAKNMKNVEISKPKTVSKSKKEERIISADDLSKVFSDDEVSHLSGDDDDDDMAGFSGDEINSENDDKRTKEKPDVWEDIYGRKRDKEGNVIKVRFMFYGQKMLISFDY